MKSKTNYLLTIILIVTFCFQTLADYTLTNPTGFQHLSGLTNPQSASQLTSLLPSVLQKGDPKEKKSSKKKKKKKVHKKKKKKKKKKKSKRKKKKTLKKGKSRKKHGIR